MPSYIHTNKYLLTTDNNITFFIVVVVIVVDVEDKIHVHMLTYYNSHLVILKHVIEKNSNTRLFGFNSNVLEVH